MTTETKESPLPTKEALQMLSRAGKSTTNQYLAFQKIEGGGAAAKFATIKETASDAFSLEATAASAVNGFIKDKTHAGAAEKGGKRRNN